MGRILPILFNTEMVCAILDGRKTVTRRAIKPQLTERMTCGKNWKELLIGGASQYQVGDILYVRETWTVFQAHPHTFGFDVMYIADQYIHPCVFKDKDRYLGKFQKYENKEGWNTPYSMPKEAARIWLKVTDVRIERLQDITEQQAKKEGFVDDVEYCVGDTAVGHFVKGWEKTIKKQDMECYGWKANPWVWVIEFEQCGKPEGWCQD